LGRGGKFFQGRRIYSSYFTTDTATATDTDITHHTSHIRDDKIKLGMNPYFFYVGHALLAGTTLFELM
jgi:hypothetical protein